MSYAAIPAHRLPFDIDGSEVGYRGGGGDIQTQFNNGIASWLDSSAKGNLNKESRAQSWGAGNNSALAFWFMFPEIREITHIGLLFSLTSNVPNGNLIQGSNDTTNGIDGTWETPIYSWPSVNNRSDFWRYAIISISFSGPMKCLRFGISESNTAETSEISAVHIYGQKAAGQTPDDVVFCDSEGVEKTSLMDWGDIPEGTTEIDTFYLKNVSTKTANGLNIQLNNADYVISWDQVNWGTVLDITSLNAGQISAPIYTKLALGPPLLILGPRAARAIVTVTSWT